MAPRAEPLDVAAPKMAQGPSLAVAAMAERRGAAVAGESAVMHITIHMKSTDIIKAVEADGWQLRRVRGSHHHYSHPTKPGIVTVPHPKKDIPVGTLRSIERQAGIKLR